MSGNRILISGAVMAATIMQVLDTTIINVALPNMAGQRFSPLPPRETAELALAVVSTMLP